MWVAHDNGAGVARFGVTVSKKNVKMAVIRNKSKRISKEIFKRYQHQFVTKDIVLVIKKFETKHNVQIWKKKLIEVYSWLEHFIYGC